MATNRNVDRYVQPYRYASPDIPISAVRRFARQIGERFHPNKIILFGSYAYGVPHNESDVDLLVIMPAYDVIAKGIRISGAFERQFSHSIIVRTPRQIERGLQQNNWFLREVMSKGKVLYEARNGSVNPEGTCRTAACVRTASAASTSQIHLGSRRARSLMILARDRRIEELA
jgi:predicted nucleotidyltransferase